jgi:hypothetical protein
MSWTIRDIRNKRASISVWVQDGLTLAQYLGFLDAFGTLIDTATLAVIESQRLQFVPANNVAWSTVPSPTVFNVTGCNFLFDTDGEHGFTFHLPAISESLVNGDLVTVTGNPPMEAIRDAILNGIDISGTVVLPRDPNNAAITTFLASKFTKAGK